MSTTNDAVMQAFAAVATPQNDNIAATFATAAGAQAQGARATGELARVTRSVATGAVTLPSIGTKEAPAICVVVNDSANSINVGAGAAGEKVNGTITATDFSAGVVAVAAGASAVCIPSGTPSGRGGASSASPNDWRIAVVS